MSDAQSQSRQRAIDYMVGLLQMNPLHQGDEIVSVRSKALGLAKKDSVSAPDAAEPKVERRKVLEQLDAIRAEFWTTPIAELQAKLSKIDAGDFADLQAVVTRLNVMTAHRGKFPALARMDRFDGDFFSSLKEILIRSPRDTAVLREQVLSSFRNRSRRKSGREMVNLIKSEMPAIYELEAGWFDALLRQKAQVPGFTLKSGARGTRPATVGSGSGAGRYWWIFAVLGSAALRALFSDSGSHTPTYQPEKYINLKSPSDLQKLIHDADKREPERQHRWNDDSLRDNEGVWQPYRDPYSPQSPEPPATRSPTQTERSFGQPKGFSPTQPWNNRNDGFPR